MFFIDEYNKKVKECGDAPLLTDRDGKRTFSFRGFHQFIDQIVGKLIKNGVQKGNSVIIILPRCSEYVAAEVALLRIGAVIVPLIPAYPSERVEYIKKDCDVVLCITEDFFDDIDKAEYAEAGCGFQADPIEDTERGMVLYTSGSTGRPKGVVYSRHIIDLSVQRRIPAIIGVKPLVYAASATMSFCVTITEYFRGMALGAHIHMLSDEVRSDAEKLADYYAQHHITSGFISPRILKNFKSKSNDLQRVFTASEKVVNICSDQFEIMNCYGQSEMACSVTEFMIDRAYDNTPIGKPIPGVRIIIADDEDQPVADGEEGQICFIGDFPHEYNNLPEQSAKNFKILPDGQIWVHTGDVGKILPDGNLQYLNRKDWMLKIHGQRVEPGEIESVMNKVNGITGSIVKAFDNEDGTMLVCGFYTESEPVDKQVIRESLAKRLPDYMIPGTFVKMDAFPVNPNGKIDRKAIEKPDFSANQEAYEAPENELEESICKAMETLLKIKRIGRNDNFYSLGGNSINAVVLAKDCNLPGLHAQDIMLGKTPKGIAIQYEKNRKNQKPEFQKKYEAEKEYPFTLSHKYNTYDCTKIGDTLDLMDLRAFYELDDTVDIPKLKKAIEDTLNAHSVFGIRMDHSTGVFFRNENYEAEVQEITVAPEKFEEYRRKKAAHKRDFLNEPLFDVEIIRVGEERVFLYMNMTHQVMDGSTMSLVHNEISDRYEGKVPAAEEYDIFDIAKYEEEVQKSDFYEKALAYFDGQFSGLEEKPHGDTAEHQDSSVWRTTSVDFSGIRKDEFLKANGISQITYIQAALTIALGKVFDREKFTYKILHSGRGESAYSGIFGSIARGAFIVADVKDDMSVKEYLNEVQERYQETVYYDVVPMQELAEKYPQVESDIYLNYRGKMGPGFHLGEKRLTFLPIGYYFDGKHIETLLNFQIDELPDGNLKINLGAGFFSQEKTTHICDLFEKALELVVTCETIADVKKGLS